LKNNNFDLFFLFTAHKIIPVAETMAPGDQSHPEKQENRNLIIFLILHVPYGIDNWQSRAFTRIFSFLFFFKLSLKFIEA